MYLRAITLIMVRANKVNNSAVTFIVCKEFQELVLQSKVSNQLLSRASLLLWWKCRCVSVYVETLLCKLAARFIIDKELYIAFNIKRITMAMFSFCLVCVCVCPGAVWPAADLFIRVGIWLSSGWRCIHSVRVQGGRCGLHGGSHRRYRWRSSSRREPWQRETVVVWRIQRPQQRV